MKQNLRNRVWLQLTGDARGGGRLTGANWALATVIVLAVLSSILATEPEVHLRFEHELRLIEILFGLCFAVEYGARIWTAPEAPGPGSNWEKRWAFLKSPLGLIELVVLIVTFLPMFIPEVAVLRLVRLLRLMMIARMGRFSSAFHEVLNAINERRFELYVTMALASFLVLFGATALYLAEGHVQPDKFGSIPRALWWAVITLTTVGYGDVSPITPLGKMMASVIALAGVGLVAMPTGIMAAAFSEAMQNHRKRRGKSE